VIEQKIYAQGRTDLSKLNTLKDRKSRYGAMLNDPNLPKLEFTPPSSVKLLKIGQVKYTNEQGEVIPEIVYIGRLANWHYF
jgi:hypothetical protein